MKRYYFDVRDQDGLVVDDEGIDLPDMDEVRAEVVQSLLDAVRDGPIISEEVTVEVRDDDGSVMTARL